MDTNAIILALAGLVVFGLIYRSASSKPEKTTRVGPAEPDPSPRPIPSPRPNLENLSKNELIETAERNGVVVRKSWNKSRIQTEIETHLK